MNPSEIWQLLSSLCHHKGIFFGWGWGWGWFEPGEQAEFPEDCIWLFSWRCVQQMCTSNKGLVLSPKSDIYVTKMRHWRMKGERREEFAHNSCQAVAACCGLPNASCVTSDVSSYSCRVKRCANASAWQLHIWIHPISPPKSLPQAPSAPPQLSELYRFANLGGDVVRLLSVKWPRP